ncbi:Disease resistance protein L6 [Linum perenne]
MEQMNMCEETTLSNAFSQSETSVAELQSVVSTLEYEVFLSFRGPDVRKSFADFLYSYLVRSKIRTFRDEEELRKGETIAPSLIQAITESKIYIPILSKSYASSKWCLQELAKMVECCREGNGHIILPVFYFMDPRDVRHQAGPYEEAFEQHSKKHDPIIVQKWRTALQEVGQMKGWHVTEIDGQGAVIDQIFSKVQLHLRSDYTLVTEELIGIDCHVQEVTRLLNLDSGDGKVVGIHGIGGMGKTTIAKAVYDNICTSFNRCCFLENIRELLLKNDGVMALQNKIISRILRDDIQVKDASEGVNIIRERVCKYKVLIVLDDVDDKFEFVQILGKLGNFSSESRFIITTRSLIKVDERNQFWMHDHLRDLGRGIVIEEDVKHPFKRSRIWSNEDAMNMLENVEAADRVEMLKVSMTWSVHTDNKYFQKLSSLRYLVLEVTPLFGDFSEVLPDMRWLKLSNCFFIPTDLNMKNVVILEIQGCVLTDDWGGWNRVKVAHKLKVINVRGCRGLNRIPDFSQCTRLESIDLTGCLGLKGELNISNFRNLKVVRLQETDITLSAPRVPNLLELKDLEELWFENCNDPPEIPGDIWKLQKLKTLKTVKCSCEGSLLSNQDGTLPSSLTCLIVDWSRGLTRLPNLANLSNLMELRYLNPHEPFPDLSRLQNLKQLCIAGWKQLPEVIELRRLKSLRSLEMKACKSLRRLPNLSGLDNLETLDVSECIKLIKVGGLEKLKSLGELRMAGCKSIKKLPDMSQLEDLREINLKGCTQLKKVKGLEKLIFLMDVSMDKRLEVKHYLKTAVWLGVELTRLTIRDALAKKRYLVLAYLFTTRLTILLLCFLWRFGYVFRVVREK